MAFLVGQRNCDSLVAGSSPGWAPLRSASVTKQYNLVLAKAEVISMTGKVNVGLVETD